MTDLLRLEYLAPCRRFRNAQTFGDIGCGQNKQVIKSITLERQELFFIVICYVQVCLFPIRSIGKVASFDFA